MHDLLTVQVGRCVSQTSYYCNAPNAVLGDIKFGDFDPEVIPPSDFYLLVWFDSLIDAGISPAFFQEWFIQHRTCHAHFT